MAAIYQETEGNPFFLSEVVALLVEERGAARSGDWGQTQLLLPQSVREVLGRRLDRLSAGCNELLNGCRRSPDATSPSSC